jgi:hypothetical protein
MKGGKHRLCIAFYVRIKMSKNHAERVIILKWFLCLVCFKRLVEAYLQIKGKMFQVKMQYFKLCSLNFDYVNFCNMRKNLNFFLVRSKTFRV